MATKKKALAPALAKRASDAAATRRETLTARGRAALDGIRRRQSDVVEAFYDIGVALAVLAEDGVAVALGFDGFEDLVTRELGMALPRARELMRIPQHVGESDAIRWGQEKSKALVELARATAENDTPRTLAARTLALPRGVRIDLEAATVREIREVTKKVRAAKQGDKRRGRTTTRDERALAAALGAALRAEKVTATVRAVATRAGATSLLRIDVPCDGTRGLERALAAVRRRGGKA